MHSKRTRDKHTVVSKKTCEFVWLEGLQGGMKLPNHQLRRITHFNLLIADEQLLMTFWDPHRVVSDEMYTWPERTRLNSAGSGLRALAGALRGRLAVERQMVERIDGPLIDYLERLDERLTAIYGERWWEALGMEPPPLR
jgi:hypothetical protein